MKLTKSPRLNSLLYEMGIYDYHGVISHLPKRYDNFELTEEKNLKDKDQVVAYGKVISIPSSSVHRHLSVITFDFMSEKGNYFKVVAYNRPYLTSTLKLGEHYTLKGTYDYQKTRINLINLQKGAIAKEDTLRPIYALPSGYQNHLFQKLVKKSFEEVENLYGDVPFVFQNQYRLIDKKTALQNVHFPTSTEDIRQGFRYLKYEEALIFSLKNQLIKAENNSLNKIKKEPIDITLTEPFISTLPFKLREDQFSAASQIIDDMNDSKVMYRLIEGDVGSGKTIVSFIALYANYLRGDQGALMAPTDALARQHYRNALQIFEKQKLKVALLLGSTPQEEKRNILSDLSDGVIDIVIGTHSLFSKSTMYSKLGLVVIDEQHRFGVNQRRLLATKGNDVDLLMMSATPIPRSLALSIYGDLDVSILEGSSTYQRDVITEIVESDDTKIKRVIEDNLKAEKQIYIVAPLIDLREDERYSIDKLSGHFLLKYPGLVSILHGKMKSDEKEKALENFYNNVTPILVATPVIEVGIDVKNAGAMIIYDANNFGLASLHQLRGRIGRDGSKATCLLLYDKDDEEKKEKLKVLTKSSDGFYIAEQDLKMRGPGELLGLRQTGLPNFSYLNAVNDTKIFVTAKKDAEYIISHSDEKQFQWLIKKCQREIEKSELIKV